MAKPDSNRFGSIQTTSSYSSRVYVGGIDPGLSGAFAIIDLDSNYVNCTDLFDPDAKFSYRSVEFLLTKYMPYIVCLEKQQAMPRQGVVSSFNNGKNYGILIGVLEVYGIDYTEVHISNWKKYLGNWRNKKEVLECARQKWPKAPLSRLRDEGRAHALWLAEYARTNVLKASKQR